MKVYEHHTHAISLDACHRDNIELQYYSDEDLRTQPTGTSTTHEAKAHDVSMVRLASIDVRNKCLTSFQTANITALLILVGPQSDLLHRTIENREGHPISHQADYGLFVIDLTTTGNRHP
jgi:hypothetical protein